MASPILISFYFTCNLFFLFSASREHSIASATSELPGTSELPTRTAKRKAEVSFAELEAPPEKKINPNIKNRPPPDFSKESPRYRGKLSPRMIGCQKILNDFMAKKSYKVYLLYICVQY